MSKTEQTVEEIDTEFDEAVEKFEEAFDDEAEEIGDDTPDPEVVEEIAGALAGVTAEELEADAEGEAIPARTIAVQGDTVAYEVDGAELVDKVRLRRDHRVVLEGGAEVRDGQYRVV